MQLFIQNAAFKWMEVILKRQMLLFSFQTVKQKRDAALLDTSDLSLGNKGGLVYFLENFKKTSK